MAAVEAERCTVDYLPWDDTIIVDEPDRWEMTVFVLRDCSEQSCTVDLTPRHCKRFRPRPEVVHSWKDTAVSTSELVASGRLTADRWGLVTPEKLRVTKERNRIAIVAAPR